MAFGPGGIVHGGPAAVGTRPPAIRSIRCSSAPWPCCIFGCRRRSRCCAGWPWPVDWRRWRSTGCCAAGFSTAGRRRFPRFSWPSCPSTSPIAVLPGMPASRWRLRCRCSIWPWRRCASPSVSAAGSRPRCWRRQWPFGCIPRTSLPRRRSGRLALAVERKARRTGGGQRRIGLRPRWPAVCGFPRFFWPWPACCWRPGSGPRAWPGGLLAGHTAERLGNISRSAPPRRCPLSSSIHNCWPAARSTAILPARNRGCEWPWASDGDGWGLDVGLFWMAGLASGWLLWRPGTARCFARIAPCWPLGR